MKNIEVLGNAECIALLDMAGLTGVKLSYAIAQNAKTLGEEAVLIQGKLKYPENYLKMKDEYRDNFKNFALRDNDGNIVIEDGKYRLDPNKEEEYKKSIESKNSENQVILEEVQKIEEEYNKLLEEHSNVTVKTVELNDLPETVNPTQISALSFMINDFKE